MRTQSGCERKKIASNVSGSSCELRAVHTYHMQMLYLCLLYLRFILADFPSRLLMTAAQQVTKFPVFVLKMNIESKGFDIFSSEILNPLCAQVIFDEPKRKVYSNLIS